MGRHAEAEPLYRQAVGILRSTLGPTHPHFLTVAQNYYLNQQEGELPPPDHVEIRPRPGPAGRFPSGSGLNLPDPAGWICSLTGAAIEYHAIVAARGTSRRRRPSRALGTTRSATRHRAGVARGRGSCRRLGGGEGLGRVSELAHYRLDDLRRFATALGTALGVPPTRAAELASHLLWFDAAGLADFGIATLPAWLERIEARGVEPAARGEGDGGADEPGGPGWAERAPPLDPGTRGGAGRREGEGRGRGDRPGLQRRADGPRGGGGGRDGGRAGRGGDPGARPVVVLGLPLGRRAPRGLRLGPGLELETDQDDPLATARRAPIPTR